MNFKYGNSFLVNNLLIINHVRSVVRQSAGIVTYESHRWYYNQVVNSNSKKIISCEISGPF
ncbi:hypothetical protein CQJ27_15945 [Escherichia sp. E1130]|nr:hypothetical protein CQJ27_15945 [Escherichia sp. E1130]